MVHIKLNINVIIDYKCANELISISNWKSDGVIRTTWFKEVIDKISVKNWLNYSSNEGSKKKMIPKEKPKITKKVPMDYIKNSIHA